MPIEYRTEGRIAIITINRPEVLNALSAENLIEISNHLIRYRDDMKLRACIITGAGEKAFCTGMDVKEHSRMVSEIRLPVLTTRWYVAWRYGNPLLLLSTDMLSVEVLK